MYAGIPVGGMVLMFMDRLSDSTITVGDNISPTLAKCGAATALSNAHSLLWVLFTFPPAPKLHHLIREAKCE